MNKEMSNLFKGLIDTTNNKYIELIPENIEDTFVDTGSFMLNAQQSGSIKGGFPGNQISVLAGDKATGKTFILLKMIKLFLKRNPTATAILWESEWATHETDLVKRGIDQSRVKILRVRTVEKFHTEINNFVTGYLNLKSSQKFPVLLGMDSFGMLGTNVELENLDNQEHKVDMGNKAKMIKKIFRTLAIPLGVAGIPLIATNHIYREQAPNPKYAKRKMTGGEGIMYAATSISYFSKSKDMDGNERTGSIITSFAEKARKAIEGTDVDLRLNFKNGLDRYYGLLDVAAEYEIMKKVDDRYKINGKLVYGKQIYKDPKKYFTIDILNEIDRACADKFKYANNDNEDTLNKNIEPEESLEVVEDESIETEDNTK